MKNFLLVFATLFFLIPLTCCNKEPVGPEPKTIDLTISGKGTVDTGAVMASDQQVSYIRLIHNKEIKSIGRGGVFTLPLDVDADGTQDFEFKIDSWSQLSGAGWSWGSVTGVHGTFGVNTYETIDTTYLSSTFRIQDGSYWGKKIAVIRTVTESCRRLTETDTVQEVDTTSRITHFASGDSKNPTSGWSREGEEVMFWNSRWYGIGLWEDRQNADTIWFTTRGEVVRDCHQFPADTANIWIRYMVDGAVKPGWIRVIVNAGQITVLESEIQE